LLIASAIFSTVAFCAIATHLSFFPGLSSILEASKDSSHADSIKAFGSDGVFSGGRFVKTTDRQVSGSVWLGKKTKMSKKQ